MGHRDTTLDAYQRLYEKALEYVASNHRRQALSLDGFCHQYGCSRRHAQRVFSYFGDSWRKMLTSERMRTAYQYAADPSQDLRFIAKHSGYSHDGHFNELFKRAHGRSAFQVRQSVSNPARTVVI